jgi:hypothetical protein
MARSATHHFQGSTVGAMERFIAELGLQITGPKLDSLLAECRWFVIRRGVKDGQSGTNEREKRAIVGREIVFADFVQQPGSADALAVHGDLEEQPDAMQWRGVIGPQLDGAGIHRDRFLVTVCSS